MKHLKAYESATENLFWEIPSTPLVQGYYEDRCRVWVNKLKLRFINAFRVDKLRGTDFLTLTHATKFIDLACEALGAESIDDKVTVGYIFSRPENPTEKFYEIGSSEVGTMIFSHSGSNTYLYDSGVMRDRKPITTRAFMGLLTEMGADIHMISVSKGRKYYGENKITMYFLVDDWVQLTFNGSVSFGPDLARFTTKWFKCDGITGVKQCLDFIGISQ
jgi:hypothetical protein